MRHGVGQAMNQSAPQRLYTDGRAFIVVLVHTLIVCATYYASRSQDDMFYGPFLCFLDFPALAAWYYVARAIVWVLGNTHLENMLGYYSQLVGLIIFGGAQWYLIFAIPKWVSARRQGGMDGLCRVCRYDLTGNVSGVCPECGTKIESP